MDRNRLGAPLVILSLAGCASAVDGIADSPAGYVDDPSAYVAAADWSAAETVEVVLDEYAFTPSTLSFQIGRPYRLRLTNAGGATHFFVSEGFFRAIAVQTLAGGTETLDAPRLESIAVRPGTSKELTLVPVVAGLYALECTAPLHAVFGMDGEIAVVDG